MFTAPTPIANISRIVFDAPVDLPGCVGVGYWTRDSGCNYLVTTGGFVFTAMTGHTTYVPISNVAYFITDPTA